MPMSLVNLETYKRRPTMTLRNIIYYLSYHLKASEIKFENKYVDKVRPQDFA